ncbi:death domain-containing protein CRADD-like, partial [Micropterus dolomieu]|uniref:death domain-containing protein CRADD-like n=1 Tax=Micropterus dolomieu TaxID=147949 RepID=UPI001E8D7603
NCKRLRLSADVRQLPDSVLQKVPSDRELSRLASRLGAEWESVLMDLGLSAEALFRCRADHPLSTHGAVLAGLVQWRRCEGKKATVERLLLSLKAADVHPSVLEDVLM